LLGDAIKIRKLREVESAKQLRDGTQRGSLCDPPSEQQTQFATRNQTLLRKRHHGDSSSFLHDADTQQTSHIDRDNEARDGNNATVLRANNQDVGNDKEPKLQRRQLVLRHNRSSSAHLSVTTVR
jgi:hypothetical protein